MAEAAQNGVNVQALLDARDALTKAPEAAQLKWRAAMKRRGCSRRSWPNRQT